LPIFITQLMKQFQFIMTRQIHFLLSANDYWHVSQQLKLLHYLLQHYCLIIE